MPKIPQNAKRVFKGVIYDVYQWQQKLFDGSTATFEMLKRPDTVVVFPVTEDQKIIITKQEQPGKNLFIGGAAGRVEKGETVEQAAERELLEETGYQAGELILWYQVEPVGKIDWTIYTFVARGCQQVAKIKPDPGEKIVLKLVSFDKFVKLALKDSFYDEEARLKIREAKLKKQKMTDLKNLFLGV